MRQLRYTGKYKKDLKRYLNQPKKLAELQIVLNLLMNDEPLPANYHMHALKGQYEGYLECHIQGDFLLIWCDNDTGILTLVRLGSHAELFNM